jgi:O-antigen/teichoic acid export membrane protein
MLRRLIGHASSVAIGTAIGQGLIVLVTPYLARHYSPAEFGALALLITVSNISVGVACLRYDLAIPSAETIDVPGLLVSAQVSALTVALLAGAALLLLPEANLARHLAALAPHPVILAACFFLVGFYQATNAWFLQRAEFRKAAALRASQGAFFSLLAVMPGLGLLWAHVLSFGGGLLSLKSSLASKRKGQTTWRAAARRYRKFPLLSMPGALLDVCGYSVCVWVIATYYGQATAGNYSQVQRLTGAPLMLLSISVGQILLKMTAEMAVDLGALRSFFVKFLKLSAALSAVTLMLVWLFGEPVLHSWLGPQWIVDRRFVTLVAVAVFVRASVSPLSTVLVTLHRLGWALTWQALYFCSALVLMPLVASRVNFGSFILFYAGHECVLYGIYVAIIYRAIGLGKSGVPRGTRDNYAGIANGEEMQKSAWEMPRGDV